MAPDIPSPRTTGLGHFLVRQAREQGRVDLLFQSFCGELTRRGLPVWRANLGLEILHPETSGKLMTWTDGAFASRQNERTVVLGPGYLNSPVRIVDETNRPYRRRLDEAGLEMPLLQELRGEGATDYVVFPLPFLDTTRTAVLSYATRAAGGFAERDIADLELATGLLSPYAERYVLRRLAVDLLDIYVGRRSGERIFGGHIERGKIETIGAAICMADLRGFTRLAQGTPKERVIAILDDWFECLAAATETHGGEILKFMGDGLLSIFPVEQSPGEACDRALAAACAALENLGALNLRRAESGEVELAGGLGLHLGEVAYGNVGGRRRLDFTVIGEAVNLAARLEGLTRKLGAPILTSEAFALVAGRDLVSLGHHAIRGLDRSEQVFALQPFAQTPIAAA
jgi:adenylate cyclase